MATEEENYMYNWKRDLEKEMWTTEYKYRWRKMEAPTAAQNRSED